MSCARCKHMKKKCGEDCQYAPLFPAEDDEKFINIHMVFGADYVMKMIKGLSEDKKRDAVKSMAHEAIRLKDKSRGCWGIIKNLKQKLRKNKQELEEKNQELEKKKQEVETLKRQLTDMTAKTKCPEAAQSNPNPSLASTSHE